MHRITTEDGLPQIILINFGNGPTYAPDGEDQAEVSEHDSGGKCDYMPNARPVGFNKNPPHEVRRAEKRFT